MKSFIDFSDDEIPVLTPNAWENRCLKTIYGDQQNFESVSKKLQEDHIDLYKVRCLFDGRLP